MPISPVSCLHSFLYSVLLSIISSVVCVILPFDEPLVCIATYIQAICWVAQSVLSFVSDFLTLLTLSCCVATSHTAVWVLCPVRPLPLCCPVHLAAACLCSSLLCAAAAECCFLHMQQLRWSVVSQWLCWPGTSLLLLLIEWVQPSLLLLLQVVREKWLGFHCSSKR